MQISLSWALVGLLTYALACLAIAHCVLVRSACSKRLPAWTWSVVEYLWFAIAFFGLIQAVLEVVRFQQYEALRDREQDLLVEFRQIHQGVNGDAVLFGDPTSSDVLVQWTRYLDATLDQGPESWKLMHFIGQNEDLLRPQTHKLEPRVPQGPALYPRIPPEHAAAEVARALLRRLDRLQDSFIDLRKQQQELRTSDWNRWPRRALLLLFPLIFAMRVTKVAHDRSRVEATATSANPSLEATATGKAWPCPRKTYSIADDQIAEMEHTR